MVQAVIKPLSSDWSGLNPKLIATFYAVKREPADDRGTKHRWVYDPQSPMVKAPLTDGNIEHVINWQSPFENVGMDQRFSSLSALLQTGGFSPLSALWDQIVKQLPDGQLRSMLQSNSQESGVLRSLEGKSSVTKLNSTQVFNGLPPMKITAVAHFRADSDAGEEVEGPLSQLISWALPEHLAADGILAEAARGNLGSLYPSLVPHIVGMQYAGFNFKPLVIEAVPYPLTGPRDPNGHLLSAQVQLTLSSLTSIDRKDWAGFSQS